MFCKLDEIMLKPIAYIFGYINYCCRLTSWYIASATTHIRVWLTKPWWLARFNVAWIEYQRGPVYRERLVNFGLTQAIDWFFKSKFEQKYCLKIRLVKEPRLRWRILFLPFTINIPKDLIIAAKQGCFNNPEHRS